MAVRDEQNPFRMLFDMLHNYWVSQQPNAPENPMTKAPTIFHNSPQSLSNQRAFQGIFDMGAPLNYQPGPRQSTMVEDRRAKNIDEYISNMRSTMESTDQWAIRGPGLAEYWRSRSQQDLDKAKRRKAWEDAFKARPYRGNPHDVVPPQE